MPAPSTTQSLRQQKRAQRRQLEPAQQTRHAERLAEQIIHHRSFTDSQRIAAYLANDGEIDPVHIIQQAWNLGKEVYLPILSAHENSLLFAPYTQHSVMQRNQFGIAEPTCPSAQWRKAEAMDLILLPLVAFDEQGNRMGMGSGFYDRSLANIRQHEKSARLIGLAHEIQKTTRLEAQSWDIPLDAIVTEADFYSVNLL